MRVIVVIGLLQAWLLGVANAQVSQGPSKELLDGITARGRLLAQYDRAIEVGVDMITGSALARLSGVEVRVARQTPQGWATVFGYLSPDKDSFRIVVEVVPDGNPTALRVIPHSPPVMGGPHDLFAARAIALTLHDLNRLEGTYSHAVLPGDDGKWWVYWYPAPREGAWVHGGDYRYLVASGGDSILDKRQMHRSIISLGAPRPGTAHGIHTAVVDDVPEDTDVLLVLARRPRIDEYVVTKNYVYRIALDGGITFEQRQ